MSALVSSWTPSGFALTQEEEVWLFHPIAPKRPVLCAEDTVGKTKISLLDTIPMAVETWLEFYNLFQIYLCVDSVLAIGRYIVFRKT